MGLLGQRLWAWNSLISTKMIHLLPGGAWSSQTRSAIPAPYVILLHFMSLGRDLHTISNMWNRPLAPPSHWKQCCLSSLPISTPVDHNSDNTQRGRCHAYSVSSAGQDHQTDHACQAACSGGTLRLLASLYEKEERIPPPTPRDMYRTIITHHLSSSY